MNKQLSILLLLALAAYGQQQERIAILNTVDDGGSVKLSDLSYLTTRFREMAAEVLPKSRYAIMSVQSIVDFLGSEERAIKECKAASCLAALGRKVNADYVAQARIGKFDKDLTIGVELYSSKSGVMVGSFTGKSKDMYGLLAVLNEKAPLMFEKMLSGSESSVKIYENKEVPNKENIIVKEKADNTPPKIQQGNLLTDTRDGKEYRTVVIGKQTWMAENLKYNAEGSKCAGFCGRDGQLYNWETAKRSCPKSWHLPSKEEWETLVNFAGGKDIAGKKLKASKGWSFIGSSGGGTDDYGFTALPRGLIGCGRNNCSEQPLVRNDCDHWWSDYGDDDQAFGWFICKKNDWTSLSSFGATYLLSVRCIKN